MSAFLTLYFEYFDKIYCNIIYCDISYVETAIFSVDFV